MEIKSITKFTEFVQTRSIIQGVYVNISPIIITMFLKLLINCSINSLV